MLLLSCFFWTTGPYKRFPVPAATDILKDVLTSYLQEEKYEAEWSQKMTKTLCEVIHLKGLFLKQLLITVELLFY